MVAAQEMQVQFFEVSRQQSVQSVAVICEVEMMRASSPKCQ